MSIEQDAKALDKKLKAPRTEEADKGRLCNEFAEKYKLHFCGFKPASGDPLFTELDAPHSEPKTIDEQLSELDGKSVEEL